MRPTKGEHCGNQHDTNSHQRLATDIMAAMGHSSLQTTMRYIDLAEAEMASVASTMREEAIEREKLRLIE